MQSTAAALPATLTKATTTHSQLTLAPPLIIPQNATSLPQLLPQKSMSCAGAVRSSLYFDLGGTGGKQLLKMADEGRWLGSVMNAG